MQKVVYKYCNKFNNKFHMHEAVVFNLESRDTAATELPRTGFLDLYSLCPWGIILSLISSYTGQLSLVAPLRNLLFPPNSMAWPSERDIRPTQRTTSLHIPLPQPVSWDYFDTICNYLMVIMFYSHWKYNLQAFQLLELLMYHSNVLNFPGNLRHAFVECLHAELATCTKKVSSARKRGS